MVSRVIQVLISLGLRQPPRVYRSTHRAPKHKLSDRSLVVL